MTRVVLAVALLAAVLAVPVPGGRAAPPADATTVTVDVTEVTAALGDEFAVTSTIRNEGGTATPVQITNLNVVGLGGGVYVDPEDWSPRRTVTLGPLEARSSKTITWHVHAVNSGVVGLVVTVLPRNGHGATPPTSPMIRVTVAGRETLDAGSILPLVLGVPALIALVGVAVRLRRRHAGFVSAS